MGDVRSAEPGTPVISTVADSALDDAFAYHRANLGEFILPLEPATFRRMVSERQVVTVECAGRIAGICYVTPDGKELDDVARWEFGGLHLAPDLRGRGLGTALSTIAIAAVTHADPRPVMGYVHHENHEGLHLLVRGLGFIVTDRTISLGPDSAAGYLRRDSAGFATANVLRLPDAALARPACGLGDHATRVRCRLADELASRLAGTLSERHGNGVERIPTRRLVD